MRINAGKHRGRKLNITNLDSTRETSDKVRQAVFNLIGQFFEGGICLDLFAGSGGVGLEAYSRGMEFIYFNDLNSKAINVIKSNIALLKIEEKTKILNVDYKTAINSLKNIVFDLIFLDPPYIMDNVDEIVENISNNNMLSKNGYLVFEMHKDTKCSDAIGNYIVFKSRVYGIKKIVIYRLG